MRRSRLAGFILLASRASCWRSDAGWREHACSSPTRSRRRDRDRRGDPSRLGRSESASVRAASRRARTAGGVYVTNSKLDSLSVIDAKTLAVLSTAACGHRPGGLP